MSTYRNSGTTSTGEQTATQGDINDAVTASAASAAAALVSENNADTSEIAAELAETNAETAQTAAELAETNAETAQTAAELAETNAETAETNASASETNAAASAVEAAASAAYTKDLTFPALADIVFPDISSPVAVSNIYEPFLESNWPLMMEDKSWYDEEGYGVDGVYHSTVTTTERDALTPAQGDVCYNSTTTQFEKYNGSAWATTYRGNKREFPARAIAVAEQTKVIIYDLTESEPVMWMVFNSFYLSYIYWATDMSPTGLSLSGGQLFVSQSDGGVQYGGMSWVNFLQDKSMGSLIDIGGGFYIGLPITGRNNTNSAYRLSNASRHVIANKYCNDIATTTLPNAPIDEYGVKGVTWAVATDGGVSVGRTDGNVWDDTYTPDGSAASRHIAFIDDGYICSQRSSASISSLYVVRRISLPNTDISTLGNDFWYDSPNTGLAPAFLSYSGNPAAVVRAVGYNTIGASTNLTLLKENLADPTKGMVNYLTTSYQSGWMAGDIKGAWLADNDDTNVTGSELVTNGDFPTDTSGWTANQSSGTAVISVVAGELLVDNNSSATYGRAAQGVTTVVGETYTASCDVIAADANAALGASNNSDGSSPFEIIATYVTGDKANITFVATQTTTYIIAQNQSGTTTHAATFDNIACRLADSDRSVNGNGLQVNGTITKTRLGGDDSLVAYSGFTAANYLEQPYNADLDIPAETGSGDGDFGITFWMNANTAAGTLYQRWVSSTERLLFDFNSSKIRAVIDNSINFSTASDAPVGVWSMITLLRRNGVLMLYINGTLENSAAYASAMAVNSVARFGERIELTSPFDGSLATFRYSLSAPSAEDIEYIYKQEKPLIVNGADAVLGGASDAITAIAWDDYKNQLKVQSADYLSTIQGSTVIKKEASTSTLVTVSDGEEVTL